MKIRLFAVATLVLLAGLAGCAGSWPITPNTVTVTATSTIYMPSPEPSTDQFPLVCRDPSQALLDDFGVIPGGVTLPKAGFTGGTVTVVNTGISEIPGVYWWVVAANMQTLGSLYNYSDPVETSIIEPSTDMTLGALYGIDNYSAGGWDLVPLTGDNLARAHAAVDKAFDCLGMYNPNR